MHMPAALDAAAAPRRVRASVEQALMSAVPGLRATHPAAADGRRGALRRRAGPADDRAACSACAQRARRGRPATCVGAIGPGLLVLVCAEPADTTAQAARLVDKLLKLRIFADDAGKMNRSVQDVGGGLLIVSQFTLAADTARRQPAELHRRRAGRRWAGRSTRRCCAWRASATRRSQAGVFGADMQVHLVNDGPVTIPLRRCA
ncbi:MAG: D-aminoacyl-tRNA deacylase [Comamonadaceae bacterium]|nr:D-aminoacyl-tRNA deacylase [Comamonadaceae bacterium]